jgi:RNA polymerase sigma-70 factor, ECF subfamily
MSEDSSGMEGSDYSLIKAVGEGDSDAFERLVRRYQNPVFNFIRRNTGDRLSAEDLTQEVFLNIYRASSGFQPSGKVKTWIFTIAYRLCLNEWKRRQRVLRLRDEWRDHKAESGGLFVSDALRDRENEEFIMEALRLLPENQRAAILLRVNEGLSYAEISKVLSVSVSSVESLIFRARTRLRQLMGKKRGE